jgi:hypothetical protein
MINNFAQIYQKIKQSQLEFLVTQIESIDAITCTLMPQFVKPTFEEYSSLFALLRPANISTFQVG